MNGQVQLASALKKKRKENTKHKVLNIQEDKVFNILTMVLEAEF